MRFLLSLFLLSSFSVHAVELPGIPQFIDEMVVKHQFKRNELENLFVHAQHKPDIIEAISRPATSRPWLEYRASFVNSQRIKLGLKFWQQYRRTLARAEKKYGVPQEVIVALIGVETIYGRNVGSYRVLDALTTLAFDYPRRADFFRSELENYLLLARDQEFDLLSIRGSYAGAMGVPQFMPSSYRKYAVDFNGNRTVDLLGESSDAIGSVANYLQGYGWITGEPVAALAKVNVTAPEGDIAVPRALASWAEQGVTLQTGKSDAMPQARLVDFTIGEGKEYWFGFNNFDVITRYNNSDYYAMSVFQLAEELKAARKLSERN